ncbi:shikimate kinase [Pedobacter mucosus]|uniref:shikimate kinase n=1 Tax=Pedobacter mucosus TaxID=2895286 RepID=UPI001EE3C730|nr:shikimate kinase [Pedobacter mucosus]UKT64151.1 AAA family ATPase [Pedobacter mucosus]
MNDGNSSSPLGAEGLNDAHTDSPLGAEGFELGIIFLIGYMGCGKSTKAKQLAHRFGCPVIDLDSEIVAKTNKSIAAYFEEYGENNFRIYESEMLKTFNYPNNCVVATGGGLPCFFDNMAWMNANGITVYLEMQPAALVSRLEKREKRPLIKDLNDEQLYEFITSKLHERNPYYTQAKVIINAFNLEPAHLEEIILTEIKS